MADIPIFVLAGQSNADYAGVDNVMAEQLLAQGSAFELVKVTYPGSSLWPGDGVWDWDPDTKELYTRLVNAVLAAEERIRASGNTPVVTTLWIQGEQDIPRGSAYLAKVEDFITKYRAAIGQPDSNFSISLLPRANDVRVSQLQAVKDLPGLQAIETSDGGTWDGLHYDRATREMIALRFLAQAGVSVPKDVDYKNNLGATLVGESADLIKVYGTAFLDYTWQTPNAVKPINITTFSGDDVVITGSGDDVINTGGNNDVVRSGAGNDLIRLGIHDDVGYGGDGDDTIFGDLGTDRLYGNAGNDVLEGGMQNDLINGGAGSDTAAYTQTRVGVTVDLNVAGYQDTRGAGVDQLVSIENLLGSAWDDVLYGNAGANILDGGAGADVLQGRGGDDTYVVDSPLDQIIEKAGQGNDTVVASFDFRLTRDLENLKLAGPAIVGTGNGLNNVIEGNDQANILSGAAGHDVLSGGGGNDRLSGGTGDDVLDGGAGIDRLAGGAGADRFVFSATSGTGRTLSSADIILDFKAGDGDTIDLSGIDADTGTAGANEAFHFVGATKFARTAGELRQVQSGSSTYLQGDVDGDGRGDFCIRIVGIVDLHASDLVL